MSAPHPRRSARAAADLPRIVIGEDEALMRHGLALMLERHGFDVVAQAADTQDLVRKVSAHVPDIVVTDTLASPDEGCGRLRAALEIRGRHPKIAIVVLAHDVDHRCARELLQRREGDAGVGFLLKHRVMDIVAFCAAVRDVALGGSVLDREIAATLTAGGARGSLSGLTARQREVLDLMAAGHSNASIAERLVISEKAVVSHISRLYETLGLPPDRGHHRRVLAVLHHIAA